VIAIAGRLFETDLLATSDDAKLPHLSASTSEPWLSIVLSLWVELGPSLCRILTSMPLNISAAYSSRVRVTKRPQDKRPSLKRSASSPFGSLNQSKPVQRMLSRPESSEEDDDDFFGDRLDDVGMVKSLATDLSLRDVAQNIQYIRSHMFDIMPENGGFNSTKIAEILNFRKSLPPTVTVAHVHAMTESPTSTERAIAELTKAGTIRRIVIPGRGTGGSSIGDGLILLKDIERLTRQARELESSVAGK